MNILSYFLACYICWLPFLSIISPFCVRVYGSAAFLVLEQLAGFTLLYGLLLCSVLFALSESQQLLTECWPVLLAALYHRFAPDRACPNWNCPRCWETRGVVLGRSVLADRGLL